MILTEKPTHYTEEAWSEYLRTMRRAETLKPGDALISTGQNSHYRTWLRDSGLFTEELQYTNAWGQDCVKFTKL